MYLNILNRFRCSCNCSCVVAVDFFISCRICGCKRRLALFIVVVGVVTNITQLKQLLKQYQILLDLQVKFLLK